MATTPSSHGAQCILVRVPVRQGWVALILKIYERSAAPRFPWLWQGPDIQPLSVTGGIRAHGCLASGQLIEQASGLRTSFRGARKCARAWRYHRSSIKAVKLFPRVPHNGRTPFIQANAMFPFPISSFPHFLISSFLVSCSSFYTNPCFIPYATSSNSVPKLQGLSHDLHVTKDFERKLLRWPRPALGDHPRNQCREEQSWPFCYKQGPRTLRQRNSHTLARELSFLALILSVNSRDLFK